MKKKQANRDDEKGKQTGMMKKSKQTGIIKKQANRDNEKSKQTGIMKKSKQTGIMKKGEGR